MNRSFRFVQVDVFTSLPFGGNQLAVFTDARGMSEAEMQILAREMNYSESTFVLPPETSGATHRVRIFTPGYEMPFAGHPTIGTAFVLASEGFIPLDREETTVQLQLNLGLMPIRIQARDGRPSLVWMEQRLTEFGEPWTNLAEVAAALGVEAEDIAATGWPIQIVSTGVPYLVVALRSLAAIRRARFDGPALRQMLVGQSALLALYLFTRETEDPAHTAHARMFSPHPLDLPEDAATGSAAGPLGAYLVKHSIAPKGKMIVEQGYEMGRPSLIRVEVTDAGGIRVGGQAVIVGEGAMYLP